MPRALARIASLLLALVVALALVIGLLLFLRSRDKASLQARPTGPGRLLPDQGAAHHPAPAGFRFASDPPASGPHRQVPVRRDGVRLTRDQLLSALELGDVVLVYGDRTDEPVLRALQRAASGPFDPALARAGQAVVLDHRTGTAGVVALAWRRLLRASSPRDPQLGRFAGTWLGSGAQP